MNPQERKERRIKGLKQAKDNNIILFLSLSPLSYIFLIPWTLELVGNRDTWASSTRANIIRKLCFFKERFVNHYWRDICLGAMLSFHSCNRIMGMIFLKIVCELCPCP